MSAETLRRAAALMRERAEAATKLSFLSPGDMVGWACDGGWITPEDVTLSEHYAPLSPAVALAVADWLDHEAEMHEWEYDTTHALAVAQAYLGGNA